MHQDRGGTFKVVLVFTLTQGSADEEIRRSSEDGSFPARLAGQPGFVSMELVKLSEDRTMSVQTWQTERDWWTALETVKSSVTAEPSAGSILLEREFLGGPIVARVEVSR